MTRKLSVEVPSIKDIIQCGFLFPSFGRESTTWPANNCLQIMVCSCVEPSKRVLLQIIFCSCVIGTTFSRETTFLREKWQNTSLSCQEVVEIWKQSWWSNDKTIIELSYHKISWFANVSQINYLPRPSANKLLPGKKETKFGELETDQWAKRSGSLKLKEDDTFMGWREDEVIYTTHHCGHNQCSNIIIRHWTL